MADLAPPRRFWVPPPAQDPIGPVGWRGSGTIPVAANPTAQVSGTAVNGAATSYMRSDAAPRLANTAVTAGSYTYASLTVDAQGRLIAASSGTAPVAPPAGANPTAQVSGTAVNGVASTWMRSDAAPALANTAVTPGSYTLASLTVDQQGRLTAASSAAVPLTVPQGGTGATNLPVNAAGTWGMAKTLLVTLGTSVAPATTPQGTVGTWGSGGNVVISAGGQNPYIETSCCNGTLAAPTAMLLGNQLFGLGNSGYGANAYSTNDRAGFVSYAAENWTNTAQGTYYSWQLTPTLSTATAEKMRLDGNGNLTLQGRLTAPLAGVTDGSNAAAGNVGEYIESVVLSAAAVTLTTGTPRAVTSVTLTAGDWDIWGNIGFNSTGTVQNQFGAINNAVSFPDAAYYAAILAATNGFTVPHRRYSLTATTTINLVAQCGFTTGTATACGVLSARRAR